MSKIALPLRWKIAMVVENIIGYFIGGREYHNNRRLSMIAAHHALLEEKFKSAMGMPNSQWILDAHAEIHPECKS